MAKVTKKGLKLVRSCVNANPEIANPDDDMPEYNSDFDEDGSLILKDKNGDPTTLDELTEQAIKLGSIKNTRGKLTHLKDYFEGLLPIARKAVSTSPTQSTIYAYTNLINNYQDLLRTIDNTVDFDGLADRLHNDVVCPEMRGVCQDWGRNIKSLINACAEFMPSDILVKLQKEIDKSSAAFAQDVEDRLNDSLRSKIRKCITEV